MKRAFTAPRSLRKPQPGDPFEKQGKAPFEEQGQREPFVALTAEKRRKIPVEVARNVG